MLRLTARLLLVLLLVGTLAPAALAISAPVPHACCMRKPLHDHGSSRDVQAVGSQSHNCCPPVTTARWVALDSGIDCGVQPLLAYLSPDPRPVVHSIQANTLRPVRGPPLG